MSNLTLKQYFNQDAVQAKFKQLLGEKAAGFGTSVLQVANSNSLLQKADPESIFSASIMAATLDLPINNNLGFAWIVPYNEKYKDQQGNWHTKCVAQFQVGWKGFVQLAQRSGQYKRINVIEVYENQFVSYDRLSENLNADFTKPGEPDLVGYVAYFQLLNGFEKLSFWTIDEVKEHGKKFSKTFDNSNSSWKTNFDAMAKKTVLKNTLAKWGPLSIEMQKAIQVDQSVITDAETVDVDYVDNPPEQIEEEKPMFTREHFESAYAKGATIELIKTAYLVTPEIEKEYLNHGAAK